MDKWVFITEPERFGEAIKTMQDALASIEIQTWHGDKITPATKSDFVELRDDVKSLREATAEQLQRTYVRVARNEERLVLILESLESLVSLLLTDVEEDQAECACASCGCGGWGDFVYENADIEDGVQAEEPALTLEMLQAADAYTVEPGSRMPGAYSVGLAGDECGCELCRPRPF